MNRVQNGLLVVLLLAAACDTATTGIDSYPSVEIEVGGAPMTVWLADESSERRSGLSGIEQLPSGIEGMLFTWDVPVSATFNMEDTPMPLDIWWFDSAGSLIGSYEMEPCLEDDCARYRSPGQVKWALETPLGEFEFEPGATLSTVETG